MFKPISKYKSSSNRSQTKEKEMQALESNFDTTIKTRNNQNVYYHITYNGEGIYNALKNIVEIDTWKALLNNKQINWLSRPIEYSSKNISYSTKEGYKLSIRQTLPIILRYLDKEKIKIDTYNGICNNVLYTDEYQIVIETSENK